VKSIKKIKILAIGIDSTAETINKYNSARTGFYGSVTIDTISLLKSFENYRKWKKTPNLYIARNAAIVLYYSDQKQDTFNLVINNTINFIEIKDNERTITRIIPYSEAKKINDLLRSIPLKPGWSRT
jgi:hypothetical protein